MRGEEKGEKKYKVFCHFGFKLVMYSGKSIHFMLQRY